MPDREFARRPPLLPAAEEAQLARRAGEGDVVARNQLVELYRPLAIHVASRFARRWPRHGADLIAEGCLALVRVVAEWGSPIAPADYARRVTASVVAACKEWLQDHRRPIRVPRYLQGDTARRRAADAATVHAADLVLGADWTPLAPARHQPDAAPTPVDLIARAEEATIVAEEVGRLLGPYGIAVRLRHGFVTGETATLEVISRALGKKEKSSAQHYVNHGMASLRSGLMRRGVTA